MPDPRVVGAAPLDPWLNDEHPYRGAFFTTLHSKWSGFCNAQMRHPWSSTPSGLESHPIGTGVPPYRAWSPTPSGLEFHPIGTIVPPHRAWSRSHKRLCRMPGAEYLSYTVTATRKGSE